MMIDTDAVQAAYETISRANRPDWDAFIAEAKEDPSAIAYEWCDVAADLTGGALADSEVDAIFTAAKAWVAGL